MSRDDGRCLTVERTTAVPSGLPYRRIPPNIPGADDEAATGSLEYLKHSPSLHCGHGGSVRDVRGAADKIPISRASRRRL